ncbi:MAG: HEPN domain-containing protein [Thermoguttaceae bacterium]|nr:HEPN domain-containing protein [Thermoguttaceae bacterium]
MTDLSKYRFETARSNLNAAKLMLDSHDYKSSINRSYYSIFHALRAVLALDCFDSSKHSGVIACFNERYVKTGVFCKEISKIIRRARLMRENADYQDFFVVSQEEAADQIEAAQKIISAVEPYLNKRWTRE